MKERITGFLGGVTGCFLAGGAITSLYTNKPINDWDLYPKNAKARDELIQWVFDGGYWCVHVSSRALTFANGDEDKIQIMLFDTFETAQKIFETFDFTVCMGAFDLDTGKFVLHDKFLLHCSQRFLSFNPSTRFPYASAWRVRKYEEKGYTIGKMEYFKILMACQALPINSWDDLKEQIGGVYGETMDIPEDKPYSMEAAFEVIANMKPHTGPQNGYSTPEQAIACTSSRVIPYFNVENEFNVKVYARLYEDDEWVGLPCKPLNGRQVEMSEVYPDRTFYKKVVVKEDGSLRSIYNNAFEYKVGEYVSSASPFIYCYATGDGARNHHDYRINKQKRAILTLVADTDEDIIFDVRQPRLKRCKVTEVTYID